MAANKSEPQPNLTSFGTLADRFRTPTHALAQSSKCPVGRNLWCPRHPTCNDSLAEPEGSSRPYLGVPYLHASCTHGLAGWHTTLVKAHLRRHLHGIQASNGALGPHVVAEAAEFLLCRQKRDLYVSEKVAMCTSIYSKIEMTRCDPTINITLCIVPHTSGTQLAIYKQTLNSDRPRSGQSTAPTLFGIIEFSAGP